MNSYSLIIPLWNEEKNIAQLVDEIAKNRLHELGMQELILVNNGSTDKTRELINLEAARYTWVVPLHLALNENYGGGVYEGCKIAQSEILCYIPGDLQVSPKDVIKVHKEFNKLHQNHQKLFVKGTRIKRYDGMQTKIVSWIYTKLSNIFLRLMVSDVNGLPKMFNRQLLSYFPSQRMKTFVFDSQLLMIARINDWFIKEVGVTFYGRREGVSSWSKKRIQIYLQIFKQMFLLQRQKKHIKAANRAQVKKNKDF